MKEVFRIFLDYLDNHRWQGRIFITCLGISIIVGASQLSIAFKICKVLINM